MTINVKFFALIKDRAGVSQTTLELPDFSTVQIAAAELAKKYPAVASLMPRTAYAINQAYGPDSTELHDGDELAFIPPVSGG